MEKIKLIMKTGAGKAALIVTVCLILSIIGKTMDSGFSPLYYLFIVGLCVFIDWLILRNTIKYLGMSNHEKWEKWAPETHSTKDQVRRIERAVVEGFNVRSSDLQNGTAVFVGGSGVYKTSLVSCSCPDHKKRRLPCKHMYKLAIDLELINPKEYLTYDYVTINLSDFVD